MQRVNRHKRGDSTSELELIEKRGIDGPIRISQQDGYQQAQHHPSDEEYHSRLSGKIFGISGYGYVILGLGLFTLVLAFFAFRAVISLFYL